MNSALAIAIALAVNSSPAVAETHAQAAIAFDAETIAHMATVRPLEQGSGFVRIMGASECEGPSKGRKGGKR